MRVYVCERMSVGINSCWAVSSARIGQSSVLSLWPRACYLISFLFLTVLGAGVEKWTVEDVWLTVIEQ